MPQELFDKDFLRKLEYLDLIARRLVFGRQQALRPSDRKGASIEFQDFREYSPGDDPRTVDWTVYARLGELFIKVFRQEQELDLWVLLDRSGSMDFGEPNKFDHARRIAAALAYVGMANMDSASVAAFSESLEPGLERLRGRGSIFRLLEALTSLTASGRTDLPRVVHGFVSRSRRPGLVVVISDFYGLQEAQRALDRLRFFKHQVDIVQVASPWELDPTLRGEFRLIDRESGGHQSMTITDSMLARYRRSFDGFRDDLRRYALRYAVGHSLARTDVAFDEFLLQVLRRGGLVA